MNRCLFDEEPTCQNSVFMKRCRIASSGIHVLSQALRSLILSFVSHVEDARGRRVCRLWNTVSVAGHLHADLIGHTARAEAQLQRLLSFSPHICLESFFSDVCESEVMAFPSDRESMRRDVRNQLLQMESSFPFSIAQFVKVKTLDQVTDIIVHMSKKELAEALAGRTNFSATRHLGRRKVDQMNALIALFDTVQQQLDFLATFVPRRSVRLLKST